MPPCVSQTCSHYHAGSLLCFTGKDLAIRSLGMTAPRGATLLLGGCFFPWNVEEGASSMPSWRPRGAHKTPHTGPGCVSHSRTKQTQQADQDCCFGSPSDPTPPRRGDISALALSHRTGFHVPLAWLHCYDNRLRTWQGLHVTCLYGWDDPARGHTRRGAPVLLGRGPGT